MKLSNLMCPRVFDGAPTPCFKLTAIKDTRAPGTDDNTALVCRKHSVFTELEAKFADIKRNRIDIIIDKDCGGDPCND